MHAQLFPATLDHYHGLVKFIYKDYPLVDIHPWAMHRRAERRRLLEVCGLCARAHVGDRRSRAR
jgi:hypothetical protein